MSETFLDFNIEIPLPLTAVTDPQQYFSLSTCALFAITMLSPYMLLFHLEWKGI